MPGLEAAACGCPVVSTRCGGPEDYVKDGYNGYLVDVGDAEGMAERLIQLLSFDDARWAEISAASSQYVQRFDWDVSAAILEQAFYYSISEMSHQS